MQNTMRAHSAGQKRYVLVFIIRDVRPTIEVAYLSTKFILMDREKNIKLNGKKMTVIEFTVQKLQIFEYLIFGVFPEIIQ